MLKHFGPATLTMLLLISCAQQQPESSTTTSQKTALVQDAKGRLFSASCLRKAGPAKGLTADCQLDFSSASKGIVKNGRGAFYDNSAYDPYTGYQVYNQPSYGGDFCSALYQVAVSSPQCYSQFGYAAPSNPSNVWGYTQGCDATSAFQSFNPSCGYAYNPGQTPVTIPPYYPGGFGYGGYAGYGYNGQGFNAGYGYQDYGGYGYGYGQPVAVAQGNVFAGNYSGQCTTHYKNATPGQCSSTLIVDNAGNARIPGDAGCFSPVDLVGSVQPGSISLRSGPWAAQPSGQTLNLMLSPPGGTISASGSGGGISDTAYTYECSYQKSY